MSQVFNCDYCCRPVNLNEGRLTYVWVGEQRHDCNELRCKSNCKDVIDDLYTTQVTHSGFCADSLAASSGRVGGR
jgi:hypothetical protein